MSPRDVTHAIENKLAVPFRDGGERNGWYRLDGKKVHRFTIPHVHNAWGKGTMNDIVRQSALTKDEFKELVACPLSASDYEALIRARKNLPLPLPPSAPAAT